MFIAESSTFAQHIFASGVASHFCKLAAPDIKRTPEETSSSFRK
jgi:hypothetical protein